MTILSRKPQPLYAKPPRPLCPVCGKTSYSPAGVHPQCSARAADEVRMEVVRAQQKENATNESLEPSLQRHQKACPKCGTIQHVRKKECECGYAFPISRAGS